MPGRRPCIWVLAGTNGAGKSSIAGAMLRHSGGDYFNPDEIARQLMARDPMLDQAAANGMAWRVGVLQLQRAIRERADYFFETTLGGNTITSLLELALDSGLEVRIWYVGLASPELHIARVAARVEAGGHPIPPTDVRRRFRSSRRNLIRLLPRLTELKLHDNTDEAFTVRRSTPRPQLVLHWRDGKIVAPGDLRGTPSWAKPIVACAIKIA